VRELSDEECLLAAVEYDHGTIALTAMGRDCVRAGYAAGYRAAQAACAPRELAYQCPNYGAMPPSLDHQPAATPSAGRPDAEAAQAETDGPAADPIAELCARLRDHGQIVERVEDADALERLARERDDVCNVLTALRAGRQDFMRRIEGLLDRAERAEAERDAAQRESEEQARLLGMSGSREAALLAERDTLRAVVRAADAMALECRRVGLISSTWLEDYDDASAKVKP